MKKEFVSSIEVFFNSEDFNSVIEIWEEEKIDLRLKGANNLKVIEAVGISYFELKNYLSALKHFVFLLNQNFKKGKNSDANLFSANRYEWIRYIIVCLSEQNMPLSLYKTLVWYARNYEGDSNITKYMFDLESAFIRKYIKPFVNIVLLIVVLLSAAKLLLRWHFPTLIFLSVGVVFLIWLYAIVFPRESGHIMHKFIRSVAGLLVPKELNITLE